MFVVTFMYQEHVILCKRDFMEEEYNSRHEDSSLGIALVVKDVCSAVNGYF